MSSIKRSPRVREASSENLQLSYRQKAQMEKLAKKEWEKINHQDEIKLMSSFPIAGHGFTSNSIVQLGGRTIVRSSDMCWVKNISFFPNFFSFSSPFVSL